MKLHENIEVVGNLKLRGGALDRVVTDTQFYSNQFGPVAFKSEMTSAGSAIGFYGLDVRIADNSIEPATDVVVMSFADEFYLTQNAPNTDEVVVSLESNGVRTIHRENKMLRRADSTDQLRVLDFTIPANMLGTNGAVRGNILGDVQTSAARSFRLVVAVNGVTVYEDTTGTVSGSAILRPWQISFLFCQRGSTTSAMVHGKYHVSLTPAAVVTGMGSIDNETARAVWGNTSFTDDSTVDQKVTFDLNFATAAAGVDFYRHFAYVQLIK